MIEKATASMRKPYPAWAERFFVILYPVEKAFVYIIKSSNRRVGLIARARSVLQEDSV